MIGLAWQRRVRIAARRRPSHKFTPKRHAAARANQFAKCNDAVPTTAEKTIVLAILRGIARTSNAARQLKRKQGSPVEQEHHAVPQQVYADPGQGHNPDGHKPPRPRKHGALPALRHRGQRRLAQLTFLWSLWLHEILPRQPVAGLCLATSAARTMDAPAD